MYTYAVLSCAFTHPICVMCVRITHAMHTFTYTRTHTYSVGAYYFNWYNLEDQWTRYSQTRHPVLGHYDQSDPQVCLCAREYVCVYIHT